MFDHFKLDNCAWEISLTRLIPRVNPSRRARGAYRHYVAANYGRCYHPGKPRESRLGLAVQARNLSNHGLRLAISEAHTRRGVNSIWTVGPSPRRYLGKTFFRTQYLIIFSYPFSPLTFHQTLQYVGVKASCYTRAGRMHTGISINLDQPDRHIFGHHKIGAVQFEAATAPFHVILRCQHHQDNGLLHFWVNQIVIRFSFMAYGSKKINAINDLS